ncbi:MAG: MFS transporter [Lachnospiraceae bacterium]|nr:MFS transporter [Lachnospiraceae bacterium]
MGNTDGLQTTKLERASYSAYFFGQNIFYTIIATYVSIFLLNMGLGEETAAIVLIAPRAFDIVNDIIFGIIVDRSNLKGGKFLPWLKISWVLIPLTTCLLFFMPESLSHTGKVIWVIVAYSLWSIAYTMCDTPIFALSTAMSEHTAERTKILSIGRVFATIGAIVATLGIEAVYTPLGWKMTAVVVSVICMICMLPILIVGRERSKVDRGPSVHFADMFKALFTNRYLLIFYVTFFFVNFANCVQEIVPIFAQYVLGDPGRGTVLLAMSLLPAIVLAFFIPKICKKVDKFWLYVGSMVIFAAASLIQFVFGYENEIALDITMILRGVGLVGNAVVAYMFTPDCVEYGHYKTGIRQEGISFAIQTFVTKLSGAAYNSISLALLAALGFVSANADAVTGMVDDIGKSACFLVFTIFAAIGPVISIPVLLIFYKLRDKDVEIMSQYNNREISREECDRRLSRKY